MSAQAIALPHPLTVGVRELASVLDRMPIAGWDGLDEIEVKGLATELMRVSSRLAAHQAAATRVLDESGLAQRSGASSTGALLAKDFGGDRAAGDRMVRSGRALQAAPRVEQALADGQVSQRQADIIAKASADVPHEHRDQVEQTLIADSARLTAKDLERRALRASDIFKPTREADADENAKLEDRERRAYANASFRMWDNHNGTHSGDFTIPETQADILRSTLQALSAPRRNHGDDTVPTETPTVTRMGQAFATLAEKATPETIFDGGPTLLVTAQYESLDHALIPSTLETGTRLSAGETRRLACQSKLLPGVMNGASVLLDYGRSRRLFSPAQKAAIAQRDNGCAFPGCDRPPQWCEVHHWKRAWAAGGTTNLNDGVLLCCHHHHVVHDQHWRLRLSNDGYIEFQASGTTGWHKNHRFRP